MLFCLTPSPSALVSDDTSPPPDPTGHDPSVPVPNQSHALQRVRMHLAQYLSRYISVYGSAVSTVVPQP
jgi:hypothetical protein